MPAITEHEFIFNLKNTLRKIKEKGVSTLVSQQFGANVKMIVKHFVPIVVYQDSTEEVYDRLMKHFK